MNIKNRYEYEICSDKVFTILNFAKEFSSDNISNQKTHRSGYNRTKIDIIFNTIIGKSGEVAFCEYLMDSGNNATVDFELLTKKEKSSNIEIWKNIVPDIKVDDISASIKSTKSNGTRYLINSNSGWIQNYEHSSVNYFGLARVNFPDNIKKIIQDNELKSLYSYYLKNNIKVLISGLIDKKTFFSKIKKLSDQEVKFCGREGDDSKVMFDDIRNNECNRFKL